MAVRKRDTSKKRQSIIDAAMVAFTEVGYDCASMDRIAEIAGASKRTVYNHFSSKEDLFQAVVGMMFDQLQEMKHIPYDADKSVEEQLHEFANAKLAITRDESMLNMFKVALPVFILDHDLAKETMAKAMPSQNFLAEWIVAANEDGVLNIENPELAAEIFWSMFSGAILWPTTFFGPMPKKTEKALVQELIEMFLSRYRS